jgi:3-dehydroquinate dehydratase/shikimate dehydrogenase
MTNDLQIASHLLRSRVGKICAAIQGTSAQEMLARATEVLADTTFLEFRLDYLPKPSAALPALKEFLAGNGAVSAVATCRTKAYGGQFDGSSKAALDILLAAAEAGFHLVDIEIESVEKLPKDTVSRLRAAGAGVIISWHDFHATKDLDAVAKRMEPFAPDYMKVIPTARALADNLTLMDFIKRWEDNGVADIVGICMGEPGIMSRVLGLRAGSAFTFAAATLGEETAPGQIAARTLLETYRIDQVDAATKVYGVAGNPIGSSFSPLMLNTAFRRETVNAVYLALQTSKVDDLFKLMREIPIQGLSVTMPLKRDVMPLLERSDGWATKIGAVNTISRMADGKFYGFNTDVQGILGPLERRLSLKGAKVLVLGAGGAARAAVFGCRERGAEVWILNRTPETAQKLARQAGAKTIKREAVANTGFDVIINATPVGMNGNKAPQMLGPEDLNARLVFDTVYNPLETPLLRMARQKGIAVITGVEMFVQQGARQFEIWTGKPAPEEEMFRVVLHALRTAAEAAGETSPPLGPVSRIQTAAVQAETEARVAAQAHAAAAAAVAANAEAAKAAARAVPVKAPPAKAAGVKGAPVRAVPAAIPAAAVPAKVTAKPALNGSKPAAPIASKAAPSAKAAAPAKKPSGVAKSKPATKPAAVAKRPVAKKPAAKKVAARVLPKPKTKAKAKPVPKTKARAR